MIKNTDIRAEVKQAGLKLWEVAEKIGTTDSGMSVMLRHELTDEKKSIIRSAIKELKAAQ